jgi:hypothetical protein
MNTFTINFTDLIGNFWTMDWEPTTSKNKNLSKADVQAVVTFIKTGTWPKATTPAAKNCYDTLAAHIANTIIEDALGSRRRCEVFLNRILDAYLATALSAKGMVLLKQCISMTQNDYTPEKNELLHKRMKKIIKSENLFAVKFAEDENWLVEGVTDMKCCICGNIIADDRGGHNPYPVRPQSFPGEKVNRCCTRCNQRIVIPTRLRFGRNERNYHTLMKMDYEELLDFVA